MTLKLPIGDANAGTAFISKDVLKESLGAFSREAPEVYGRQGGGVQELNGGAKVILPLGTDRIPQALACLSPSMEPIGQRAIDDRREWRSRAVRQRRLSATALDETGVLNRARLELWIEPSPGRRTPPPVRDRISDRLDRVAGVATIRRILIGFDFSDASRRAAVEGVALAEQLGAEATVISVLEVGDLRVAMKLPLKRLEVDEVHERVAAWVDRQYDKLQRATNGTFRRVIRRGIPAREIAAEARRGRADLIVLAAVGISRRITLGSVAREVVRHSPVPVMLVPKSGRRRS
jgi:nucleotide-binding universal stress UspA family protein